MDLTSKPLPIPGDEMVAMFVLPVICEKSIVSVAVFGHKCKKRGAGHPVPLFTWIALLPQQGQDTLWQLVGLGHHCRTSLLQDLSAAEVGGFRCEVGILDAAASCRQVFA